MYNPFPPIGHHWQDSTHISFGVLTAGVYTGWAKLEGSIFHGREPDEDRWDLDLGALDSWSARLSVNPSERTSFQVSYGYVHSRAFQAVLEELGARHIRTPPYTPRWNGKVERFIQTLDDE